MQTGQYDGVSASGDATLRLIAGGDVAPVNTDLIPNYANVFEGLKDQPHNTVDGVAYGVPHGRGANLLMFNTTVVPEPTDSWSVVFDGGSAVQGQGHRLRLRDLHRRRGRLPDGDQDRSSGSPTRTRSTRPSSRRPWTCSSSSARTSASTGAPPRSRSTPSPAGDMVVGTTWQYQVNVLQGATPPVPVEADQARRKGTTGWSDTLDDLVQGQATRTACTSGWTGSSRRRPTRMATVWFGEAPVSQAGLRRGREAVARSLRPVPCDRRGLLQGRVLLEHAERRVPRRPGPDLQGLLRLDEGLDRDQGLIAREPRDGPRLPTGSRGPRIRTTDPHDDDPGRAPGRLAAHASPPLPPSRWRRLAAALYRRPRAQLGLLLAAPLGWLFIAYLGSLVILFISAFWRLDPFSGDIVTEPTLQNFEELLSTRIYRTVAIRTVGFAALVTVTDDASWRSRSPTSWPGSPRPRTRALLVVSILLPLWSGYLVKVYAWRLILSEEGVLNWVLAPFGLQGPGYGDVGRLARDVVPVAAVHDHPDLRRASNASPARCSRHRVTSAPGRRPRSGGSSCRSSSRRSWPARSSRSR